MDARIDVGMKAEIHAVLRAERDKCAVVLVVSSDLEEVMTISDRIAVMVSGRLVAIWHSTHCQRCNHCSVDWVE